MNDITRWLSAIDQGDPQAASQLLPLVYDELRRLAAQKLAHEQPGQTLQATALVHEAYLRLLGGEQPQDWDGRRHFFATDAEADAVSEAKQKEEALKAKETALEASQQSERDAKDQLFLALLNQARAGRFTRQPGQRLDSLAALEKAAAIRPDARLRD